MAAAEGEELMGQRGRPVRRLLHPSQHQVEARIGRHLQQAQVDVPDDRRQEIVEFMRHPAGELSDRFKLLSMPELLLETEALREIDEDPHQSADFSLGVPEEGRRKADINDRTVFALSTEMEFGKLRSLNQRVRIFLEFLLFLLLDNRVRPAQNFGRSPSEEPLRRRVPHLHPPLHIERDDWKGGGLDQGRQGLMRLARGLLIPPAKVDVFGLNDKIKGPLQRVPDQGDVQPRPERAAFFPEISFFGLKGRSRAREERLDLPKGSTEVFREGNALEIPREELLPRISGDPAKGGIDLDVAAERL